MNRFCTFLSAMAAAIVAVAAPTDTLVIDIKASAKGSVTPAFNKAIDKARRAGGRPVLIRFTPNATYRLTRTDAVPRVYHVSNTTSADENSDATKHIGLLIKGMKNLTVDGRGARFLTEGELTPWVIDSCENVKLRNFSLDASDPSVPEMTVTERTDSSFVAKVNASSCYRIDSDGALHWVGTGWDFARGIAQIDMGPTEMNLRCGSPMTDARRVRELAPGVLEFVYSTNPPAEAQPGNTYQMRHSFRTEVAGLINFSHGVELAGLNLHFLGNFGIVAQMSTDITYSHVSCRPDPSTGRVDAGFADFMQVSGCNGLVSITDCDFSGAHDDPINIHGTHLRIVGADSPECITVRYMHGQTFGFQSFVAGDTVRVVNPQTLLQVDTAVVTSAAMISDYDITLTLDRPLNAPALATPEAVVENITRCPAVNISGCYFEKMPTRGILVTTWRPVRITDNTFFKCPMPAILIADDARSWYESGPVTDVLIRGNRFIDCSTPVIAISPECIDSAEGVHSNIRIVDNQFTYTSNRGANPEITARATDGLTIESNSVTERGNRASLRTSTASTRANIR